MRSLCYLLLPVLLAPAPLGAVAAAAAAKKKPAVAKKPVVPAPAPAEPAAPHMSSVVDLGIQNAAAMVPFYELLHRRREAAGAGEPLRVLQFGDSHTASDDWAGEVRVRFQQQFGDGGAGFTQAGRPFAGFRRFDSHATMSRNWKSEGLLSRSGDGNYGLGGVSIEASRARETITLDAEGQLAELFYWTQPGGGSFSLEDGDATLESISTDGPPGPAYWRKELRSGPHHLVLTTESAAPVRLFGWVLEKRGGVTWETLGINGAQASMVSASNIDLLRSHVARRNPALVVLAYGTNEARRPELSYEGVRDDLLSLIRVVRAASPTTAILVVGAPDQVNRTRRAPIGPALETVLRAQRDAAVASGCAFWNLRAAMGGSGSMKQWVQAGLAQKDWVHLTAPGYRLVGDSLYELIMGQYGIFETVRSQVLGGKDNGSPSNHH